MKIAFGVHGTPKAQPRPRSFARKIAPGKFVARVYDEGTAEAWKSEIAKAAREHLPVVPLEGALEVAIWYSMPRPKSHYGTGRNAAKVRPSAPKYHLQKPDLDNLDKAVLDALTQIGMWKDDCQITWRRGAKSWSHKINAGATIEIADDDSEEYTDG